MQVLLIKGSDMAAKLLTELIEETNNEISNAEIQ